MLHSGKIFFGKMSEIVFKQKTKRKPLATRATQMCQYYDKRTGTWGWFKLHAPFRLTQKQKKLCEAARHQAWTEERRRRRMEERMTDAEKEERDAVARMGPGYKLGHS